MKTIIGNNLRYLRHFFDLTVSQMCDVLNISESHYRKIESKHRGITTDKLSSISNFFEISMEQFLSKEENAIIKFIHVQNEDYVHRI